MKLRVPYFKQAKWYTCGPACLRMILSHLNIKAAEKDLEKACGTTELGTTPTQLVAGAFKFNVNMLAVKNATVEDIQNELKNGKPVIVLIDPSNIYGGAEGFGHFVLVVGLKGDEIVYHDPDISDGIFKRCKVEIFLKAWDAFKNWMIGAEK